MSESPKSENLNKPETFFVNVEEKKTFKSAVLIPVANFFKSFAKKFLAVIKWPFLGKRKIPAIIILIAAAVAVAIPVTYNIVNLIIGNNKDAMTEKTYQTLKGLYDANSFNDGIAYIDNQIDSTSDESFKFVLKIAKCNYYTYDEWFNNAIECLDQISEDGLTDEQKFELYNAYIYAYTEQGDEVTANAYRGRIEKVYPYMTEVYKSNEEVLPILEELEKQNTEYYHSVVDTEEESADTSEEVTEEGTNAEATE